ncbi:MAG TPA: hypothetical protein VMU45_04855 [Candidatus Eisenbacteria bacterium]|nr:hypothetical protein [Candidatus Eisenbacteria bacterium]
MSFLDDFVFTPTRLGLLIVLIVLAVLAFTAWRNARIDALARSALGNKPDVNTVKRLASYSGQRSGELLLVVASGAPTQENRLAALQALVDRKDAARVSRLSELLLPTESFAMRQAVANAIYQTGCSVECVRNILYYEERIWRGDRPSEVTDANPPPGLSQKEKELQTALDEILRKNKAALGAVLERTYGLAGSFPSPFAIEVVTRLGITEACPLLMRTYLTVHENVKASPEYKNVVDAVDKLGCKNQPIRSQP